MAVRRNHRDCNRNSCIRIAIAGLALLTLTCGTVRADEDDYTILDPTGYEPPPAGGESQRTLLDNLRPDTPAYFRKTYLHLMAAPLPKKIFNQGGIPPVIPQLETDRNPFGKLGSYQPDGPTITYRNAFFQSLGTNGRSCVTCHQPPSGMSVSVRNVKHRLTNTGGRDPIFAPVDGANCPDAVAAADTAGALYGGRKGKGLKTFKESHSLLINKGLIRIGLPWPPPGKTLNEVQFALETANDKGCNASKDFGLASGFVSVFRRPVISSNLVPFKTSAKFAGDPQNGNIMWDGREPTLASQAIDATLGHAQADTPPTEEQVQQIVDFEIGIFSAQYKDNEAGLLTAAGATGGPIELAANTDPSHDPLPPFGPSFNEFDAWTGATANKGDARQAINRGQAIFNTRQFTVDNVAGFNDVIGVPSLPGVTCALCHSVAHAGSDLIPGNQRDIGTGGGAFSQGLDGLPPASDLPMFKITCKSEKFPGGLPLPFVNGNTVIKTNDPGKALLTGLCKDVGSVTVPSLRGLSSHEPYFHDGSAPTLKDVVIFYDNRFHIGLTPDEQNDLTAFLSAL